jgi:hypothetical protein
VLKYVTVSLENATVANPEDTSFAALLALGVEDSGFDSGFGAGFGTGLSSSFFSAGFDTAQLSWQVT